MSDHIEGAGVLYQEALRLLRGEIGLARAQSEIVKNINTITPANIDAATDFLIQTVNDTREQLDIAYVIGELALAAADELGDSERAATVAMSLAGVISLKEDRTTSLELRQLELHEIALKVFVGLGKEEVIPFLLYNVGNAYAGMTARDHTSCSINAISYYEAALLNLPDDAPAFSRAAMLQNLGSAYLKRSDSNKLANVLTALDYFKKARDITDEKSDPQAMLSSLYGMLQANESGRRMKEAVEASVLYKEAVRVVEEKTTLTEAMARLKAGGTSQDELRQTVNLALDYAGALTAAPPSLRATLLRLSDALAGGLDHDVTKSKADLHMAEWYRFHERPLEAMARYEQVCRRTSPDEGYWWLRVAALTGLAEIESSLGNTDEALRQSQEAIGIASSVGCHALECDLALTVGRLFCEARRWADANEFLHRALSISRRMHDTKLILNSLCMSASALIPQAGQDTLLKARVQLEEALTLARRLEDTHAKAQILGNLGIVCRDLGDIDAALRALEESLSNAEQVKDYHALWRTAWALARVYRTRAFDRLSGPRRETVHPAGGAQQFSITFVSPPEQLLETIRREKALPADKDLMKSAQFYEQSVQALERLRSDHNQHEQRIKILGEALPVYYGAMGALILAGKFDDAVAVSDGPRARTLGDIMDSRDRCWEVLPEALTLPYLRAEGELLRRRAEQAAHRQETPAPRADSIRIFQESITQYEQLLSEIHRYMPAFDPSPGSPKPSLSSIKSELNRRLDTAIVVFSHNSVGVAAFILQANSSLGAQDVIWTNLFGLWDDPNAEVHMLLPSMRFASQRRNAEREDENSESAYDLLRNIDREMEGAWQEIFSQVHASLSERKVKKLILIPPRSHRLTPLAAMNYIVRDRRRYLIDDFEVTCAPSLLVWDICRRRVRGRAVENTFAAVTDPTGDLPFTRVEAAMISRLFGGRSRIVSGKGATVSALRGMSTAGYLHIGCHGTFSIQEVIATGLSGTTQTSLWLAPSEGRFLAESFGLRYDPVTSAEIQSTLSLYSNRIVVLSACNTGMTEFTMMNRGDEQFGLAAAFLMAGAAAVVCSLWPVDDIATALLMERFYETHLRTDSSIGGALRDAQIFLRGLTVEETVRHIRRYQMTVDSDDEHLAIVCQHAIDDLLRQPLSDHPYEDPYYWASFIVWGE